MEQRIHEFGGSATIAPLVEAVRKAVQRFGGVDTVVNIVQLDDRALEGGDAEKDAAMLAAAPVPVAEPENDPEDDE